MSGDFPKARTLPAESYAALKAASRRLVKQAGGVESGAEVTRVGRSNLGDYGNPNKPESFAPVDVVADLERDVGDPIVTRCLAAAAGYQLVTARAAGSTAASCGVDFNALMTAVTADLGAMAQAVIECDADGQRTAAEIRRLQGQAQELLSAAQRLADAAGRLTNTRVTPAAER